MVNSEEDIIHTETFKSQKNYRLYRLRAPVIDLSPGFSELLADVNEDDNGVNKEQRAKVIAASADNFHADGTDCANRLGDLRIGCSQPAGEKPRRRGRKKKCQQPTIDDGIVENPPKRRGRKKRSSSAEDGTVNKGTKMIGPVRRRGRPRKKRDESVIIEEVKVPKKRGRKRKLASNDAARGNGQATESVMNNELQGKEAGCIVPSIENRDVVVSNKKLEKEELNVPPPANDQLMDTINDPVIIRRRRSSRCSQQGEGEGDDGKREENEKIDIHEMSGELISDYPIKEISFQMNPINDIISEPTYKKEWKCSKGTFDGHFQPKTYESTRESLVEDKEIVENAANKWNSVDLTGLNVTSVDNSGNQIGIPSRDRRSFSVSTVDAFDAPNKSDEDCKIVNGNSRAPADQLDNNLFDGNKLTESPIERRRRSVGRPPGKAKKKRRRVTMPVTKIKPFKDV